MKIVKKAVAAAALMSGVALALSASPVSAGQVIYEHGPNLVVNGGFETGTLAGWTPTGNFEFTGVDGPSAHTGNFGLFAGPTVADGGLGGISQVLATTAGAQYNIHVWLRSDGGSPNEFQVQWNGTTVYDSTNIPGGPYGEIVIDPLAIGGDTLTLLFINDPGFLNADDIGVVQVPEPMSLALLGLGLGALGLVRRRKQVA